MKNKKNGIKYQTVMLIDDNEIDNFINEKMIQGCGFSDTIYVHTGSRSALEFLSNLARSESIPAELIPNIIFLDINMPVMDGFQFLEEYEKLPPRITDKCKIIMLTTSINPLDLKLANANRFVTDFVNKPLTQENLDSF